MTRLRGPDDDGLTDRDSTERGMRRLAALIPRPGQQPHRA